MKKIILGLSLIIGLAACSAGVSPPIDSEISSSGYTHGEVVWMDLASPDPEISADFYESVFGWTTTPYGEGSKKVWIFENEGVPVGLMADYSSKNNSGEWIGSISVPDVGSATEKAKSMGAAVLQNPVAVENLGDISFIEDAQGAHISFIKLTEGDPKAGLAIHNSFLGLELWSTNPQQSIDFYSGIVGYTGQKAEAMKIDYTMLQINGQNCIGVMKNLVDNVRSHFVPYVRVADVNATVEKAKAAGAQILIAPSPEIRGGTSALFLDPTGAPLAIQVYNP